MSTQVTLNISNITNNGVPCKSPVVLILGATGEIAFPCGNKIDKDGNIKLTLPTSEFANNCIQVVVKCDECGHCPEQERAICLCSDSNDCPACETCSPEGICISKCSDKEFCKDNTCVECDENNPCPKGFICINGKCVCLGKINEKGDCVQCLGDGDCSQCESCQNNQCIEKICPNNLTCISGDCSCPPGTKYDVVTNSCIPVGCDNDSQCGECETCIAGNCTEVICPPDYKCVGGECVYWPCINTSCGNSADCGPECTCIEVDGVKQCVPCYTLTCDGECAQALGCKCNTNTDKCEPVDNCGDYCDGSTPCLDSNCTCYNNRCVNCENFPCIEGDGGCDSYYNCGCTNGDCGGGKGCNDKLELKKIENCSTECALEATYTTESNCGCDPIEFRVKNVKSCDLSNPRPTGVILNLEVGAYKNGIAYADYLNQLSIGDDELLNATIKTQIKFFTKNASGAWVPETVNAVQVPEVSALGNIFDPIVIANGNIGFTTSATVQTNRKAEITLTVVGVKVPANNCIEYGDKVIANYSLDFTSAQIVCNAVETYKAEVKTILTDNDSIRRPLFIWSKSNTGTFLPTKYKPSTNYNESGWFRKEYGEKIGNVWTDKVSKPTDGLWNNLNYKVTVDCGCKSNTANLEKVVFCCPTEFNYNLEQCGRKITVLPFPTCEVNRKLEGTYPKEVQTFYYVTLNGTDYLLRPGGGHLLQNFVKELEVPITSIVFSQRYEGTPLVAKACDVEYTEEVNAPDFGLTAECGKLTVTQLSGTNPITSVKIVGTTQTFTKVSGQNKWELVVPKNSANFKVAVTFQNLCVFVKEIGVVCEPKVEPTPTSLIAKGECPNGGTNPNITLDAVAGFVGVVEFLDPRPGKSWVDGVLSGTTYKTTFNNFAAGTYTFTARQKTNNAIIATTNVTIEPPIKLELTAEGACNQSNGKLILKAAPGSIWSVFGSGFPPTGGQRTIPSNGVLQITIPNANAGGSFTVSFVSDPTGKSCGGSETRIVPKEGGIVNVTITAPNSACRGSEIPFTINDGGAGLQYTLLYQDTIFKNSNGTVITTINGGQSGTFTYNGTASQIFLNPYLTVADCYTAIVTSKTVNIKQTPNITPTTTCTTGGPGLFNISFTANPFPLVGTPTVTVGSSTQPMTYQGNGLYIKPATPNLNEQNYTINGVYDGCPIVKQFTFPECNNPNNCPPVGPPNIVAAPQYPCTVGTTTLSYTYGLIFDPGDTYEWVDVISNTILSSGPITSGVVPPQDVTAGLSARTYKLIVYKDSGACSYPSDPVEVQAQGVYIANILGPGVYPNTQALTSNINYNYTNSLAAVPGATFSWTKTNPGGGAPISVGTTADITTSFLPGLSILTLTVTINGCEYTDTQNIQVDVNCSVNLAIALSGVGSDGCKDIESNISNIAPGDTVNGWTWLINNTPSPQTGLTLPISNFDTSGILAGENKNIKLVVTTSNGCTAVSNTLSYTKCSCICDISNTCVDTLNQVSGGAAGANQIIGNFGAGTQLAWAFSPFGVADRLQILQNNIIILDTGNVSSASSTCFTPDPCVDVYLGDEGALATPGLLSSWSGNSGITLTVGVGDVPNVAEAICSTDNTTITTVGLGSYNGILGNIGGVITLTGGELKINVIGAPCGLGTAWDVRLKCI